MGRQRENILDNIAKKNSSRIDSPFFLRSQDHMQFYIRSHVIICEKFYCPHQLAREDGMWQVGLLHMCLQADICQVESEDEGVLMIQV